MSVAFFAELQIPIDQIQRHLLLLLKPNWLPMMLTQCLLSTRVAKCGLGGQLITLRAALGSLAIMDKTVPTPAIASPRKLRQVDTNISSENGTRPSAKKRQPRVPNPNKANKYGETPLHIACKRGQEDKLRALLAVQGVDVNAADHNGWTPLHEAASNGHAHCVRILLQFAPR